MTHKNFICFSPGRTNHIKYEQNLIRAKLLCARLYDGTNVFQRSNRRGICDATASCWRWRLRSSVTLYSVGWKPVNQWNTSTGSQCKHLVWCDALLCLLGTITLWACRYSLGGLHHLTDARHVGWTCGFLHCILMVFSPTSVGLVYQVLCHQKHAQFKHGPVSPSTYPWKVLHHLQQSCYFQTAALKSRLVCLGRDWTCYSQNSNPSFSILN